MVLSNELHFAKAYYQSLYLYLAKKILDLQYVTKVPLLAWCFLSFANTCLIL